MKISGHRRAARLGDLILRELSTMMLNEVRDTRLSMIVLSGVRMNTNLRVAEVFYSVGSGLSKEEAKQALDKATGFLRTQLGQRIQIRFVPELRFKFDNFLEDMVYAKPAQNNSSDD